ncbi:Cycloeucalenol cycloisomerase [Vitis vinifera]|uniref:Cycloeucalenol cycloisomerase n=1 Tax=Vitis vinifera TaxID=29760 RepID=A0A438EY85_VITVI|nr:Cycloeucalenol cycloisomerase [Vitis vinifera]RVX18144.1 Cycloeucalenol cycloisomerase [Vitis vinifera]
MGGTGAASSSLWLATNPSKRWGELFFLLYTPFWLTLCLGIVVPYKLYENFTELEYLLLGLVSAVPSFLIPMRFAGEVDRSLCLKDRYWVKVPHTTFLLTHVCFLFYHMSSNITLRRLRHSIADLPEKIQWFTEAAWILALAYFIAYLETIAISNLLPQASVATHWTFSTEPLRKPPNRPNSTSVDLSHACYVLWK